MMQNTKLHISTGGILRYSLTRINWLLNFFDKTLFSHSTIKMIEMNNTYLLVGFDLLVNYIVEFARCKVPNDRPTTTTK